MPKYMKRTRKRSVSRKRRSRRPRRVVSNLNYCRQRLVDVQEMKLNQNGFGDYVVCWQQTRPANFTGNQQYATFDRTDRWDQVSKSWDQFSITGVKIEWMPFYNTQAPLPGTSATALRSLYKIDQLEGSDTLGSTTQQQTIIAAPGFRNLNPLRPWKKFYSCKKLSKQQNVAWQDNQKYQAGLQNPATGLTKAATMFRFSGAAVQAPVAIGTVKTTWYCHMRGQVNP